MFIRRWLEKGSPTGLLVLGVVVGMGGAVGAALFHTLIYFSTLIFYGHNGSADFIGLLEQMPMWQRVLIPTTGGLLVGIIFKLAKVSEAEGEGVPEVMEALAEKKSTIRPIVAPVKIITAALTLGSGGSAGREGPIIQIGSAIGSSVAQFFKLTTVNRRLLLASGAAAGIGGTFGAPMAGVLFTVEILHHRPKLLRTIIVVVSAFTGAIVARQLIGDGLRFPSPSFSEINILLVSSLFALSLISVAVALFFEVIFDFSSRTFRKLPLPHLIKPALGGLLIGIIGLFLPYIHEPAAYPLMVDLIKLSSLPITLLLVLLIVKMLATGITLGSGGSGGVFAPLLLLGAIVGSILGGALLMLGLVTPAVLPILVIAGMATVFASASHAPLTAAFITYEITGNIYLLPVLLACCLLASLVARRVKPVGFYRIHHEE